VPGDGAAVDAGPDHDELRHPESLPQSYAGGVRRLSPLAAVLVAVSMSVAACGGSSDKKSSPPRATTTTQDPDAAARAEITSTFDRFFSAATPIDERLALLENGEKHRQSVIDQTNSPAAKGVTFKLTSVKLDRDATPPSALVTFEIANAGVVVFPNGGGSLKQLAGKWVVAEQAWCGLLRLQGNPPPDCA
jgi:hypothetical protein